MDERMKNLNLVEILKDCPEGTKLYSTIFGEVEFLGMSTNINPIYKIDFRAENGVFGSVTADGKYFEGLNGECTLFPSREQRDWSKFKPKKPKFDPKTLQPFDKILVRNDRKEKWQCSLFSYINNDAIYYPYTAITTGYKYCIPYNNDTKHLVGTINEAPEFYRYWEE